MINSTTGGVVDRIVREILGGLARSPISLPDSLSDDALLPEPFALDVRGMPSSFTRTARGHEVRWTVAPDGGVGSRGWIYTRFDGPDSEVIDIRSLLIRAVPSVEDAVGLPRYDLGARTAIVELDVHGHTAIGARSPEHPGRSMLFW